jgi:polar amino acid transport system substrate-binding protein
MFLALIALLSVAQAGDGAASFPKFRHVDAGATAPTEPVTGDIKLLADEDFAPFSFRNANGVMAGISIEIALGACSEMHVKCEIVAKPFAELMPALARGEGDVIITGLRTTAALLEQVKITRPYFFSTARFLARKGTPFATPDVSTLTRGRIGFAKGTSHQAFLDKYYSHSSLISFEGEAAVFEALRTGAVDVIFTDSIHASFWLKGSASRGCCVPLGASFIDRDTFSHGLSFLTAKNREGLREGFDYALNKLEASGASLKIFAHYLPDSPF